MNLSARLPSGVVVTCTRSNRTSDGSSVTSTFNIDYSGVTFQDLLTWATSSRVISGQRTWEKLSPSEHKTNIDGMTFQAASIGKKVKSRAEKITDLENAGLPHKLAVIAVDDPKLFETVVNSSIKS